MEYFPNFEVSVTDERLASKSWESLWNKWPFESTARARSTSQQLEQGVDDSDFDVDIDDMLFINENSNEDHHWLEPQETDEKRMTASAETGRGYPDSPSKKIVGMRGRTAGGECSNYDDDDDNNNNNNVTRLMPFTSFAFPTTSTANREKNHQQPPSHRCSDESLRSASNISTSPSSTTSNPFFKLDSGPTARSQPINIRRPKRVLILLESGVVVTPSSDYADSNDRASIEDGLVESAILEPRSPPQDGFYVDAEWQR